MPRHPERTEHTFFCLKCREEFERSEPGKCDSCGLTLVPSGYCPKCEGYWRRRVGELCPEHGTVLEGEASAVVHELEAEARAVDPGLDAEVVFRGDALPCSLLEARLLDAGIEASMDDGRTDIAAFSILPFTEGMGRVLVHRRDAERAKEVVRQFEAEAASETAGDV